MIKKIKIRHILSVMSWGAISLAVVHAVRFQIFQSLSMIIVAQHLMSVVNSSKLEERIRQLEKYIGI